MAQGSRAKAGCERTNPQPIFLLCVILLLFCFAIQVQIADTVETKSLVEAQGKRKLFQEIVSRNSPGRVAVVTHFTLGIL